MTGTFRLTGAEFKKIFKRPSVFIMALILVATIFVSIYIYKPVNAPNTTVDYNLSTSYEYYNTFYNQDMANTEKGINQTFDSTNQIIAYHKENTLRYERLYLYYNDIIKSYESLESASFENQNSQFILFKNALENFITTFDTSFDKFGDYSHLEITKNNQYYLDSIKTFRKILEKTGENNIDPGTALSIIKTNDYLKILENEFNTAINYINPTLLGIAKDFQKTFKDLDNLVSKNEITSAIESQRKKALSVIEQYKNYYGLLIDNDFPIVAINNDVQIDLTDALDYGISILSRITTQGTLTDYVAIRNDIQNSNIVNFLIDISSEEYIEQILVSKTLITDLEKAQKKVNENIVAIKNNIEEHKDDEGISKIQFDITEYKLLSETYSAYIDDLLTTHIAEDFSYNDFIELYGYDFKDYNEYMYNERITTNKYYLENNVYSNSFINNFSFGQNSSTETNVFDFMYFALEICAVVITIFAMMQICNLITNETESGTITLLLVRPYKRGKIITAKLLTTIFFVLTFLLFSTLISFAGGMALFGYESRQILAVFNGTTTMTISPLLLMLINIFSLTIDIIFFVIVALMIATILKNYAGSITACIITLILHYVLNILFGSSFWYSFLPGVNLHLFKFFGNNFIGSGTISSIATIFTTPIQSSVSILFSAILIVAYSLISLLISYTVFRNRDY